jgi:hypothetical protein
MNLIEKKKSVKKKKCHVWQFDQIQCTTINNDFYNLQFDYILQIYKKNTHKLIICIGNDINWPFLIKKN